MLSGLKFIPRDQVQKEHHNSEDDASKGSKKSARKKEKDRSRRKSLRYSSSDDERSKRVKKGLGKKKKFYASDEDLSSRSESDSEHSPDYEERKWRKKRKQSRRHKDSSEDDHRWRSNKKSRSRKKELSSNVLGSESDNSSREGRFHKRENNSQEKNFEKNSLDNETTKSSGSLARKEMGLDWMIQPNDTSKENPVIAVEDKVDKATITEEVEKVNPRELNPYFNKNGSGYPHESGESTSTGNQLLSSSLVGDGGASWRLKAFKRAKEQAAREGRELDEVVEDRWGSFSHLAVSIATCAPAPTRAHLHAIKNRRKGVVEEERIVSGNYDGRGELLHHVRMEVPKVQDSLSWGNRKLKMSSEDSEVVSAAISGLNKFTNDGSFLGHFVQQKNDAADHHADVASICSENRVESSSASKEHQVSGKDVPVGKPTLTANQLAAKVMQLRMKGKHEEAEKLMREVETIEVKQWAGNAPQGSQFEAQKGRYVMQDASLRKKRKEEDADLHLAKSIMGNHQYSMSGRADDEYDYDKGPMKKSLKKGGSGDLKATKVSNFSQRMLTQKERCQFCIENPNRPKHLVVAIADSAYLSLPQWEPVVQGHCCILTMLHESATRSVDDNVWNEIRNFKKCLMMMFAKQEKDVLFLETVIGITRQRRHCMVECIPLPREIAKQAPLYFKKAIDEAEDEWSQHNAKKLIDTSKKGLRGSIPKNFPYFYVEFGLDKGFVHVVDNEDAFQSSFGLNVIRGMLDLPAEDMHGCRKHESVDKQKQAVASFVREWEPFDWTKQLQ